MHSPTATPNHANQYDSIVVGAGNAALCAAIAARLQGARVLVLERGPLHKRGGNSYFTDGAIRFAYNDLSDIRQVIPRIDDEEADKIVMPGYAEDDYYGDLMRVTGSQSDPALARQLVSRSLDTIKWMHQQGVVFDLIYDNQSFLKDGKHHFWGGLPVKTDGKGIGLIQRLNERAEELDIDVWYDTRAVQLVTKDDRIAGVIVQQGDDQRTIPATSVILASGSFEANKELRAQHIGAEWNAAIVRGSEYNTGDGIRMAVEVGAQRYGEYSGCHAIGTDAGAPKVGDFTKPGDIYKKHSYPLGIMLNRDGLRFVDEGADFRNYTYAKYGREILKQPGHVAYQIFDAQVRPMLRKEYNLEEATLYQADTLEELVAQLDVDKAQFLKTIQEYNTAVQDGDYNPTIKDAKGTSGITPPKTNWAQRIEQGPFYAFPVTCGITFAFGGIKASTSGEVLDAEDQPIPGLFAAGEMIGGIFYQNYPGGSGLMSGAVFGKLAGESAARYVRANQPASV
ncbi:FAD-dependent tricarballylate dehydrogenase TcuA [Deinococcus peraridilitoris]|uniref:Succinate dehydrogenase/fumarate reductase flavoprotein subunit n=1 Tax=Deinococcus peraridilitoris (strain DSM 19664 / LMG 22246 / CIP 109416 / KR-200) TaxID=937777 RepID=L0A6W4_DEIPD|nr:FAD-dependent tricarballylate dehydrogenase TcuA [Deinococcus peraridilitoris]AFZ69576.1 succinate dehydrogenase/fumarate reductase flavoprotein subunit [Deinococcus peraridilitoris DSM 19664]